MDEENKKRFDNLCLKILQDRNLKFLSSILFSLELEWSEEIPTAGTNGIKLIINPNFFFNKLSKEERFSIILHELWHVAKLHPLRRDDRDPLLWNMACDYVINNMLLKENNYSVKIKFPKGVLVNKEYEDLSEEEIYETLVEDMKAKSIPLDGSNFIDVMDCPEDKKMQAIGKVSQAVQSAKMQGDTSSAGAEYLLNKFTKNKLNWRKLLRKYMTQALDKNEYSWKKPNRRYPDIYLPSLVQSDGRLTHLIYCLDVSGSISDKDIERFNSEVKYIKSSLNPDKLTLVQFDVKILRTDVFTANDRFDNIQVVHGGGTSYDDIRELILKEKPTATVIFTDLCCSPMSPINKAEVYWVTKEEDLKYGEDPLFGKKIVIPKG